MIAAGLGHPDAGSVGGCSLIERDMPARKAEGALRAAGSVGSRESGDSGVTVLAESQALVG